MPTSAPPSPLIPPPAPPLSTQQRTAANTTPLMTISPPLQHSSQCPTPLPAPSRPAPIPAPLQLGQKHRRRDLALSSEGAARALVPPPDPARAKPRQGKPIFDWISRKLGARRGSESDHTRLAGAPVTRADPRPTVHVPPPVSSSTRGRLRYAHRDRERPAEIYGVRSRSSEDSTPYRTESHSLRSYQTPSERRREANNPYPSLPIPLVRRSYPASTIDSGSRPPSMSVLSRSRTPSIASLSSLAHLRPRISIADDASSGSFRLAGRVADEDASVRPIPPSPTRSMSVISRSGSVPLVRTESMPRRIPAPSPPPTHRRSTLSSSLGATSDEGGIRSREDSLASTKPTTVMSFDSGPPHAPIAVAPPASAPPRAATAQPSPSPISPTFAGADDVRIPRHTRYHPRNNPHPSSPPGPDASTLTLASSTFAAPPPSDTHSPVTERPLPRPGSLRLHTSTPSAYHAPHLGTATSPTVAFADRPGSFHDGTSTHAMSLSVRTGTGRGRADDDASMRAVRRRGSWESGESRWSWRPGPEQLFALNRRSELLSEEEGRSIFSHGSYRTALDEQDGIESTLAHRPLSVAAGV